MSDIVEQLRDEHSLNGAQGAYAWGSRELCGKAAAEILALRERVAGLEGALHGTQHMLETIARTNSTDFAEVRQRIMSNRAALKGQADV